MTHRTTRGVTIGEEAVSRTVKELVKATMEEEMAELKAGLRMEHHGASGLPRNAG